MLEGNSWKEQGGWKKKAAHDVLVREDAKGHLRGGIMEIQQGLEIPENQVDKFMVGNMQKTGMQKRA